ncbi:hypothetical protein ACA910_018911 [Epithemia clementina (nom. ined.)]
MITQSHSPMALSASDIMDASLDAIMVTDQSGVLTMVNQSARILFGFVGGCGGGGDDDPIMSSNTNTTIPATMVGRNLASLLMIGDLTTTTQSPSSSSCEEEIIITPESLLKDLPFMNNNQKELKGRKYDGTEFPVKLHVRMIVEKNAFVVVCRDLTTTPPPLQDDKPGEEVLLVSEHNNNSKNNNNSNHNKNKTATTTTNYEEHLNQSILDTSFDAILVTNQHGEIVTANPATLTIFGYDALDQVVGHNVSILVGGNDHADQPVAYMEKFCERGGRSANLGKKRHMAGRRRDGEEFPCRVGVRKVPDSDCFVSFIQDTTQEQKILSLAIENKAAEELLFNMLPHEIAHRLKDDPGHIADHFGEATIMFADIVGFTKTSSALSPIQVVSMLNSIFSRFDENLDKYGLNKVKTIGDCYMVTCIPAGQERSPAKRCAAVCHFAMDMIHAIEEYNNNNNNNNKQEQQERSPPPLSMRIGVNTGPVVAGVVGTKRFLYDIWGDAVNVASRMESTGVPGQVQVTQAVVQTVQSDPESAQQFGFARRGMVQVKGIGEMETFFIETRRKMKRKDHWGMLRSKVKQQSTLKMMELMKHLDQLEVSMEA